MMHLHAITQSAQSIIPVEITILAYLDFIYSVYLSHMKKSYYPNAEKGWQISSIVITKPVEHYQMLPW